MKNEKYLIESIVTKDYNTPYAQEDTYKPYRDLVFR